MHYKPFGERGWLAGREDDVDIQAGDVRDAGRVLTVVEGCEVVFHLAALIGIPYSYVAPESYVQTNVMGTQNVAAACRRAGVARMVHTSTSETYGTARARAHRRGPPAAAPVAVLGVEDRRRHDGAVASTTPSTFPLPWCARSTPTAPASRPEP